MISEQRVQRVPGTVRGRFRLLTGAVLLSTIAGSAWTDNPVASGEWQQGSDARYKPAGIYRYPALVYETVASGKHLAFSS